MSPNGWTDNFLCTQWFEKVFIPQAKACNKSRAPILLIYDGHGSHMTKRMVELALENNIHPFCLPPHTTHKLQPLNVSVFGPLQNTWQEHCDNILDDTGEEIRQEDIIKEYMAARNKSVTPEIIRSAWQKCGMAPLNPNIFTAHNFTPSQSTSTSAHMPASYPRTQELHVTVGSVDDGHSLDATWSDDEDNGGLQSDLDETDHELLEEELTMHHPTLPLTTQLLSGAVEALPGEVTCAPQQAPTVPHYTILHP